MTSLRSALVAVQGDHTGPWQCSRGHEVGVRVSGLGVGESVMLEHDSGSPVTYDKDGTYPFPSSATRFRFLKQSGLWPSETFVQVVLK